MSNSFPIPEYQTKQLDCTLKSVSIAERIVEGYASTYSVDSARDMMMPGCFKSSIQQRFTDQIRAGRAPKIKVLWQHDPNKPVGVPIELKETPQGLYFKCKISKTQLGDELLELIKDGVISSCSIGFKILNDKMNYEKDVREIKDVKLMEWSFVTFACQEEALITGWKDAQEEMLNERLRAMVEELLEEKLEALKGTSVVENAENAENAEEATQVEERTYTLPDESGRLLIEDDTNSLTVDAGLTISSGTVTLVQGNKQLPVLLVDRYLPDDETLLEKSLDFFEKGIDKLNGTEYIAKYGRKISRANQDRINAAMAALQMLLDEAGKIVESDQATEEPVEEALVVEEPVTEDGGVSNEDGPENLEPTAVEASVGEKSSLLQLLLKADWATELRAKLDSNPDEPQS